MLQTNYGDVLVCNDFCVSAVLLRLNLRLGYLAYSDIIVHVTNGQNVALQISIHQKGNAMRKAL